MAFFPRAFYEDTSSFTPLFRLLDDFDTYSRGGATHHEGGKRSGGAFWQPRFDVRETAESYELHGELPGLSKDNVHIEFTEPQTLVVRGRSERTYTAGTPPAGVIEEGERKGAITEGGEGGESHRATVEDVDEGKDKEGQQGETAVQKSDAKKRDQGVKYWLTERSVGEFSRTFTFPAPVDQDGVSAGFRDGILSVVVPKAKKQGSRRITIN
ncbi:uncharacterized protein UV8b_03342 [Ustilaginoidea virens]|uniref:SHSP domain-containing protein n=1 Tax=Ustilaginoidea virens TaxID=1159556 RepID=A0A8E5MGY7_USTVR|nr:uncharacterized protein UV8b_03342 [Ustilaginoidea virens]QUC19101.1 hypothetical protein UV8b_03342 [Ustilaginoidea virens]